MIMVEQKLKRFGTRSFGWSGHHTLVRPVTPLRRGGVDNAKSWLIPTITKEAIDMPALPV